MEADRYVVAGNPVAHSKSPLIHTRFAAQTGQRMVYERLLVALGGFPAAAGAFFAAGGKGMNITLPFKQDACALAAELTPRARLAGAVNTLALQADGRLLGDNTDGLGLLRDIESNLGWPVEGRRVLLIGAGGAVRGVLEPLLAARPRQLVIANRTAAKALELAAQFAALGPVLGAGLDAAGSGFDLVINATSASLGGAVPAIPAAIVGAGARCYDMAYARQETAFMAWAREQGASAVADGLGMLVEQAAEAFALWRGVRPDTGPVLAELRDPHGIRTAAGPADMATAAMLFREYQGWLGEDLCFQGFEAELAGLPGKYAAPGGALLLADRDGEPAGCVALRDIGGGCCEMKRLYVRGAARGTGLGRALARAVIARARAAGYRRMRLDTLDRLREAMGLYASLGFRTCPAYYDNPLGNVVFWELDLGVDDAA